MSDRFRISRPHGKVRGLNKRGYVLCGCSAVDEQKGASSSSRGAASESLRGTAESSAALGRAATAWRAPIAARRLSIISSLSHHSVGDNREMKSLSKV